MKRGTKLVIAKFLEALGIAATLLAFVQGLYGDMWGELYLFIGGIVVFLIGRYMEKQIAPSNADQQTRTSN